MKFKQLLLPATLAIGYASFSQPGLRETSSKDMLTGNLVKYEFATSRVDFSGNRKINTLFEEKISINMNDATLSKVLKEVRRQTHLQFIAHPNALNFSRKVNIHLNDATIEQTLAYIERAFSVRCFLSDETIIVKLKTFVYNRIYCQVVDSAAQPVPKAFVMVKGLDKPHHCNEMGTAFLENITGIDTLLIYAAGYSTQEVVVESEKMTIVLKKGPGTLPVQEVTYNKNGIKTEPTATSTGSYLHPSKLAFQNRNQDFNIIRRLQLISIPFLISKGNINGYTAGSARGINTFRGNRNALNIVNGHAQMVNTNFINPNDIYNIYQIRDAEAASLWGVASSNGVYNFELKKGITSGCDINLSLSRTIGKKPNLFYQQGLNAASRIELEKLAYKGKAPMAWSPVFERLSKTTSDAEVDAITQAMIQEWGQNNLTRDLLNTAYERSVLQQIGISVQTGSPTFQHYISIGVDDSKPVEKGDRFSRITALVNTTFQSGPWDVQTTANIAYIKTQQNFVKLTTDLPYLNLNNIPSRNIFTDSGFLNPNFVYQDEAALADHTIQELYQSFTSRVSYQSPFGLKATVNYQFSNTNYNNQELHALGSHYTRTLLNDYRQNINGNITWPIPVGDITDKVTMEAYIHSLHGRLDYEKKIGDLKASVILGTELRSYDINGNDNRMYASNVSFYPAPIDYATLYNITSSPGMRLRIPYKNSLLDSADNLIGHYESGTLSYLDKYTISFSTRTDYMNRFSPDENKHGIGLWSAGASWYISKEKFYTLQNVFKELKVRFTAGQNGNVDYSIPPVHSIQSSLNQGLVYNYAIPSTQRITWEKLFMLNAGIDFATKVIKGSLDLYKKRNYDLLQNQAWNPTAGTNLAISNSGSLKGSGIDFNLEVDHLKISKDLSYSSTLLLARSINKVTSDDGITRAAQDYTIMGIYIPRKGYAAESIFAYQYGGLNEKGAPRGYLNGILSEAYDSILTATDGSTLRYMGSATPTMVANITHSLHYKSFTVSCLFTLKTGYYVRTAALNYFNLLQQAGGDAPGFESRWQKEGNELTTDIPAVLFPINISSMHFYEGSTAHIVRGDHLRLQDVQLSYQTDNTKHTKFPFKKLEAIVSVSNVGIIWRANKKGIDPDVTMGSYPQPRNLAITLKLTY